MTSVSLLHLWLNRADDLSDFRKLPLVKYQLQTTMSGQFRSDYASERVRLVRTGGKVTGLSALLLSPPRADLDWVRDSEGETLIIRTPDGDKLAGSFLDLTEPRVPPQVLALLEHKADESVTIEFTAVTYDESV